MDIEVTALQAGLLRALTWSGGTAQQIDHRLTIRDKVEAQIGQACQDGGVALADGGAFQGSLAALTGTLVTVDLSAAELEELHDAVQVKTWGELPRNIADVVRALSTWLRTMYQEARDYEALQRLPEERRRALEAMRDR